MLGDGFHESGFIIVSGGGAATDFVVTCETGSMLHTLEPIAYSPNIFRTKTGLFMIQQGSIEHSTISALTTARFLVED